MNLTHLGGASLWLSWNCGKMPIWHVLWFWGNSLVTKHHLWRHESGRCNAATEKVDGKQSKIGIQTTITQRRNFSAANLHSCDTTFSNRKSLTWIDQNGSLAPTSTYTLNEHFTLQRFNHLGSIFWGLGGEWDLSWFCAQIYLFNSSCADCGPHLHFRFLRDT